MRRWFVVIAVIAVAGSFVARAEEQEESKSYRESFVSQRLLDRLSLTDNQRAKVKELRVQFEKVGDDWKAIHKSERDELRKERATAKAASDKAKLEELEKKWQDQFKPLQDLRQRYLDRLRALLTDDQKKKLNDELEHVKQRWAERRGDDNKD